LTDITTKDIKVLRAKAEVSQQVLADKIRVTLLYYGMLEKTYDMGSLLYRAITIV